MRDSLLVIGAPRNAIPSGAWYAWTRPVRSYDQYTYRGSVPPVFIHQFSRSTER